MSNNKLNNACLKALKNCMNLKSHETLLVISDFNKRDIGLNLFEVGKKLAKESFYVEIKERTINGEEPPEQIAELMKKVNCVICPTTKSLTHTNARREASKLGVRIGTMPGITEEIMVRGLNADISRIVKLSNAINKILCSGEKIWIETQKGSNISFNYKNRKIISSTGLLVNIGDSGNLPSGEVFLAPLEGTTNGSIVVDGSIAGIGMVKTPVEIFVKDGYAKRITGGSEAKKFEKMLKKNGTEAFAVAEFGIGTNYKAKLSGQILEDEKVLSTIHIAFGNNISMGGNISVASHYDVLIQKPDVYIDNIQLMKKGKIILENFNK